MITSDAFFERNLSGHSSAAAASTTCFIRRYRENLMMEIIKKCFAKPPVHPWDIKASVRLPSAFRSPDNQENSQVPTIHSAPNKLSWLLMYRVAGCLVMPYNNQSASGQQRHHHRLSSQFEEKKRDSCSTFENTSFRVQPAKPPPTHNDQSVSVDRWKVHPHPHRSLGMFPLWQAEWERTLTCVHESKLQFHSIIGKLIWSPKRPRLIHVAGGNKSAILGNVFGVLEGGWS